MIDIPSSNKDFLQIAHIHKEMLKDTGFLSECSEKFIAKFYKCVNTFDSSLLFVVRKENNDIVGFIFLSSESRQYYKKFLLNNLFLILFYPSSIIPLIKAVLRKSINKSSYNYYVELVQIAIDASSRGKGFGKLLIQKGLKELYKRNISTVFLQVHADNHSAIQVYKKIGFKTVGKMSSYKRVKLVMKLDYEHLFNTKRI